MDESLEKALLDMEARDQALRGELTAAGELDETYHPRLEELHRANAARLRQIIAVFGWPGITLVSLTFLWGAYALVDGVVSLWAAISGRAARKASLTWRRATRSCGRLGPASDGSTVDRSRCSVAE